MRRRSGSGVAGAVVTEAVDVETYLGVKFSDSRTQKLPLLQLILRRSLEMVPVMCPPPEAPQSVSSALEPEKLPPAVLPCWFFNVTDAPL
jgi:hypothetical protein